MFQVSGPVHKFAGSRFKSVKRLKVEGLKNKSRQRSHTMGVQDFVPFYNASKVSYNGCPGFFVSRILSFKRYGRNSQIKKNLNLSVKLFLGYHSRYWNDL